MSWEFDLLLRPAARRALSEELPPTVAAACWEFCDGALRTNPHRVGKPLEGIFAGSYAARRGTWRIRYLIDEDKHRVIVTDIAGRADIYHRNRADR